MFGNLFDDDGGDGATGFAQTGDQTPLPPSPRNRSGLAGIYNQGSTCFLNSALQVLAFTPEFRSESLSESLSLSLSLSLLPQSRSKLKGLQTSSGNGMSRYNWRESLTVLVLLFFIFFYQCRYEWHLTVKLVIKKNAVVLFVFIILSRSINFYW